MLNKPVLAFAAAVALIGVGVAHAEAPFHRSNDEAGWVMHGPEYRKVGGVWKRIDVWNGFDNPSPVFQGTYRLGEPSADGLYEFVGGDEGWRLRPHRIEFRAGRVVHSDDLGHGAPRANQGLKAEELMKRDWPTDG